MNSVTVTKVKTSKQNVKVGDTITIQVYAYSANTETGAYRFAFRLNAPKLKT